MNCNRLARKLSMRLLMESRVLRARSRMQSAGSSLTWVAAFRSSLVLPLAALSEATVAATASTCASKLASTSSARRKCGLPVDTAQSLHGAEDSEADGRLAEMAIKLAVLLVALAL